MNTRKEKIKNKETFITSSMTNLKNDSSIINKKKHYYENPEPWKYKPNFNSIYKYKFTD